MTLHAASLASGSSGNSYYIACDEGAILVDAGLPAKTIMRNLELAGGEASKVVGVVVTHDHHDHIAGAGVLQRKFGWRLWMTPGTYEAAAHTLGRVTVEKVTSGSGFFAAGMRVELTATPHDGREPVAVTLSRGSARLGVFTDLGYVFPGLAEALDSLDFVFLESNYDPELLGKNRRYPQALKARIRGNGGHLANAEAALLLSGLGGSRLRRIVLSHLSEENNRPETAYGCFVQTLAGRLPEQGMKLGVAPRHLPMRLARAVG